MIGNLEQPELKCRAGESRGLLKFTLRTLKEHVDVLGEQGLHLVRAGDAIERYAMLLKTEPRVMSMAVRQDMMNCAIGFNMSYKAAGGHEVPKFHSFIHMTYGIGFMGNPAYYSTYEDESENGLVARIGRSTSMCQFSFSVLVKLHVSKARL